MSKKSKKVEKPTSFAVYFRILKYVVPYLKLGILCFLSSLVISILHTISFGIMKPVGDILFTPDGRETFLKSVRNLHSKWGPGIADFLWENVFYDRAHALTMILLAVFAVIVVKNIFRYIHDYLTGYITTCASIDISNELFDKVLHLPRGHFSQEGETHISSKFAYDLRVLNQGLKSIFGKAVREPLKALGTLSLALYIHWQLTLGIFIVFPVALIAIRKIGKRVKKGSKKRLAKSGNLQAILEETFQGIDTVKAYQMEERRHYKFREENKRFLHYSMKVIVAESLSSPIMEILVIAAGVALMIFSGHMVLKGDMTPGDFLLFYGALGGMFDPVRKLAEVYNRIMSAAAAGERVFELMDEKPEKEGTMVLPPLQKTIEFRDVSFSYAPDIPVLRNVSFTVNKGETIALVGKSGAGKSTLVSLLLRYYDVDEGAILFDGTDIRDATLLSLREKFGVVSQHAFLFDGTIAENIRHNNADLSQEAIAKAAKMAYANGFIDELENDYETIYGKGGVDLSGGQRHRISLARAIVRDPEILVLDEAMANLDAESEDYIKAALEEFSENRTSFIIAHRFSTIEKADRILVLNEGKVEGFGTHDELLGASATYRDLYTRQTEGVMGR